MGARTESTQPSLCCKTLERCALDLFSRRGAVGGGTAVPVWYRNVGDTRRARGTGFVGPGDTRGGGSPSARPLVRWSVRPSPFELARTLTDTDSRVHWQRDSI